MNEAKKHPIAKLLVLLVVVLLVIGLANSLYVVRQNEYGVVREFGAVHEVKNEPGLYFKMPYIQSVSYLPKTMLLYDLPISDVITADKHKVS